MCLRWSSGCVAHGWACCLSSKIPLPKNSAHCWTLPRWERTDVLFNIPRYPQRRGPHGYGNIEALQSSCHVSALNHEPVMCGNIEESVVVFEEERAYQ